MRRKLLTYKIKVTIKQKSYTNLIQINNGNHFQLLSLLDGGLTYLDAESFKFISTTSLDVNLAD